MLSLVLIKQLKPKLAPFDFFVEKSLEISSPQSDSMSSESDSAEEGLCGYLKTNACRYDLQNINNINNNRIIFLFHLKFTLNLLFCYIEC